MKKILILLSLFVVSVKVDAMNSNNNIIFTCVDTINNKKKNNHYTKKKNKNNREEIVFETIFQPIRQEDIKKIINMTKSNTVEIEDNQNRGKCITKNGSKKKNSLRKD